MTQKLTHGEILGGTIGTDCFDETLRDYHDVMGLHIADQSPVSAQMAEFWGAPKLQDARQAILKYHADGEHFLRLVEQPVPAGFKSTRTFGWAAYELTVQDVFGWPEKLKDSGFEIVGPPKDVEGLTHIVAMQMNGRNGEMLYLNEVRASTENSDLPLATAPIDKMFICILAASDRKKAMEYYIDSLNFEEGDEFTLPYSTINRSFELPGDFMTTISILQKGRMPNLEVDQYPDMATQRPVDAGFLPPGNSMLTMAVDDLDKLNLPGASSVQIFDNVPFENRRSVCFKGTNGEIVELIEAS